MRVHGGGFVATNSQVASRESGLPFESLLTQFALNVLLGANLDNDPQLNIGRVWVLPRL